MVCGVCLACYVVPRFLSSGFFPDGCALGVAVRGMQAYMLVIT